MSSVFNRRRPTIILFIFQHEYVYNSINKTTGSRRYTDIRFNLTSGIRFQGYIAMRIHLPFIGQEISQLNVLLASYPLAQGPIKAGVSRFSQFLT